MSHPPRPPTSAVIHVAAFRAALRSFLRDSERVARASGLTPQRYLLLLMIKGAPDGSERTTITELAERLALAQSTVTELVQRAEQAGLIERRQAPHDARVVHLSLSERGARCLEAVHSTLRGERARLRQMLDGPE
jgi:DNA-binding MarR family transcriptional regulator